MSGVSDSRVKYYKLTVVERTRQEGNPRMTKWHKRVMEIRNLGLFSKEVEKENYGGNHD